MRFGSGRVLETRSARYHVAWIPLRYCPIPGWSACLVQAVDADRPKAPAIRLTLYERIGPLPDDGDGRQAA